MLSQIRPDDYIFILELKNNKEVEVKYTEANMNETLDFMEIMFIKGDKELVDYLYNFINSNSDKGISKLDFGANVLLEFSTFLEFIKDTRFKGLFNKIKEGEQAKEDKNKYIKPENILEGFKDELGKIIAYLSEKMSIDPKTILERYSWVELNYWWEWFIYWDNERAGEEGQKINKAKENQRKIELNKDYYEDAFSKLDAYLNNLNKKCKKN